MASIRGLFRINEMARGRGDATWSVLDWAAQQPGDFTVKDLYRVYQRAGGEQGYTSFHTTIGHLTAKTWKDQEVSEKRPLAVTKQGSRGAGGSTQLHWGLEGPLREPGQAPERGDDEREGTAADSMDDAYERLEDALGPDGLRTALTRWKGLQLHQLKSDVQRTVPKHLQMDAFHVAAEELVSSGQVTPAAAHRAEDEMDRTPAPAPHPTNPLPDAPGASSQRPHAAPQNDEPLGRNPGREPEEEDEPEDTEENEPAPRPTSPGAPKKSPLSKFFKR